VKREIINGSLEPVWRANARRDADAFRTDLWRGGIGRRRFLAGAGSALLFEYLEMRRAVAWFPRGGGEQAGITQITNSRTGSTYQWIPAALTDPAMMSGDIILLPAGQTYQHGGVTYQYANWQNSNSVGFGNTADDDWNNMFLGDSFSSYGGITTADYGTLQGSGALNNGRALLTPAYGVLAQDFVYSGTATEIYFETSTPVSNFNPANKSDLYVVGSFDLPNGAPGKYAQVTISFTGIDTPNNGLTGVTASSSVTIPAGTVITSFIGQGNSNSGALFRLCGQNPGWTFTNIEFAFTQYVGNSNVCPPLQQSTSAIGLPEVGSMTLNNCYLHDCAQGPGIGYSAFGQNSIFAYMFDTELARNGVANGRTHNTYIGHVGEFLADNLYSHDTAGTHLVKTRAYLNIIRYGQIRGERTDANTGEVESCNIDVPNGGLTYIIGNVLQQSLNSANQAINYAEENPGGSVAMGATNPIQELYVVNNTIVGPANGTGYSTGAGAGKAAVRLNKLYIYNPEITMLSQASGGSLPARQYFIQKTLLGTGGGETLPQPVSGFYNSINDSVYSTLSIGANNVVSVASPVERTGAASYNVYANYADPQLYLNYSYPQPQEGNLYYWDAAKTTYPVFSQTSGGTLISVTGTLTNGSASVTGLTGLAGLASLAQLRNLSVYVGGTATGLSVSSVNPSAATLTLSGNFIGTSGSATITFGIYLYCGITYATSLGDSINLAIYGFNPGNGINTPETWYDGSLTEQTIQVMPACTMQVDPGNRLIVNAPPSGPSWATGVNFWVTPSIFSGATGSDWGYINADGLLDAGIIGLSKQTGSPIAFGSSWTSPAGVVTKTQTAQGNMFLQNASSIAIGTNFTEPTTGIVNNNPSKSKLQWFRRAATNAQGITMDIWYAIAPSGGLSGYSDTIYFNGSGNFQGAVSVIRGVSLSAPFDVNFPFPAVFGVNLGTNLPAVVSTADEYTMVLASIRSTGTAGSGFTQITNGSYMNAEYAAFSSAQSALSVTETGGAASNYVVVDALAGSSAAPALISSVAISGAGSTASFSIASADEGDVLYLQIGTADGPNVLAVGQIGLPVQTQAIGTTPLVLFQNNITANFNLSGQGGDFVLDYDTGGAPPVGVSTETTNLAANPFNGSTFGTPSWSTVFADPTQSDYDYALASGSPALNAASNPGSSPEGQSLIPAYQTGWSGLPTPGTPIPAKTARSDVGPSLTGAIGALA
jgi:hypothetical protein